MNVIKKITGVIMRINVIYHENQIILFKETWGNDSKQAREEEEPRFLSSSEL